MIDLGPTPVTTLVDKVSSVVDTMPTLGNAALLSDSVCTTGRAALNFYCSPNLPSKVCFGVSCACGIAGAVSSGTALATSTLGIPTTSFLGNFGARAFNRLGKYTLHLGNITSGNITNVTEIANLVD